MSRMFAEVASYFAHTQNRDGAAIQAKLDELIRSSQAPDERDHVQPNAFAAYSAP